MIYGIFETLAYIIGVIIVIVALMCWLTKKSFSNKVKNIILFIVSIPLTFWVMIHINEPDFLTNLTYAICCSSSIVWRFNKSNKQ